VAKFDEKIKARKLRRGGESIKIIAKKLKVSPGSVSVWCKDIVLSHQQIKNLENRYRDPHYGRRQQYLKKIKTKKEQKILKLRNAGIKDVGKLSKRELFLVGASLYWAEGFKKDNQAGLASSDPKMINFYIKWLKNCFGYQDKDFIPRVTINISHKKRAKEIQKYWVNTTGISEHYFQRPFYQNFKWKKTYENPNDYYGVLRIKVRKSTDFLRKIHGWIEGLKLNSH
jgi:hypothetical protein